MSSQGLQPGQTIGGAKALCMTIGSLTPVGRAGAETGCPHLPPKPQRVRQALLQDPACATIPPAASYEPCVTKVC